ncbi:MAG: hypothetical protein FD153_221 [Rhodospirillaceae bacterium]|nr:MAG: hypothetical protein FD153_221 [Rhodospirillaceae bacterium]
MNTVGLKNGARRSPAPFWCPLMSWHRHAAPVALLLGLVFLAATFPTMAEPMHAVTLHGDPRYSTSGTSIT